MELRGKPSTLDVEPSFPTAGVILSCNKTSHCFQLSSTLAFLRPPPPPPTSTTNPSVKIPKFPFSLNFLALETPPPPPEFLISSVGMRGYGYFLESTIYILQLLNLWNDFHEAKCGNFSLLTKALLNGLGLGKLTRDWFCFSFFLHRLK